MTADSNNFAAWGLLELFGHQRIAGQLSETTIGGCHFIRVDVPPVHKLAGYTRFFTQAAIFSLSPLSEAVTRQLAEALQAAPVHAYDLPRLGGPDSDDREDRI